MGVHVFSGGCSCRGGGGFDCNSASDLNWSCHWVNEHGFRWGSGDAPCFGAGLGSWDDAVVRVDVGAAEDAAVGIGEEAHDDVEGARVCEIHAGDNKERFANEFNGDVPSGREEDDENDKDGVEEGERG